MTTSLQRQLLQLQDPASSFLDVDRLRRTSIIFPADEAAKYDRETFYQIGLKGLRELVDLQPDLFRPYLTSKLFDEASKRLERTVLGGEENHQLDGIINEFLIAISPYMMTKAPLQCMEWLVNRFHIEKFNLDSVLQCILPYYDTKTFALVIKIFEEDKFEKHPEWLWLLPSIQLGVPLPKATLFGNGNVKFVAWIFDTLTRNMKVHESRPEKIGTYLAFVTSTLLGILNQFNIPTQNPSSANMKKSKIDRPKVVIQSVWTHVHSLLQAIYAHHRMLLYQHENLHSSLYMILTMLVILRKESPSVCPLDIPASDVMTLVLKTCPPTLRKHAILLVNLMGSVGFWNGINFGKDNRLRDKTLEALKDISQEMDVFFAIRLCLKSVMMRAASSMRLSLPKFWEWLGHTHMSPHQRAELLRDIFHDLKDLNCKAANDRLLALEYVLQCERKYPIEFSLASDADPEFVKAVMKAKGTGPLDQHAVALYRQQEIFKIIQKAKDKLQKLSLTPEKMRKKMPKDKNRFAQTILLRFDDDDKDVIMVLLRQKLPFMKSLFTTQMLIKGYSCIIRKRQDDKCTKLALTKLCKLAMSLNLPQGTVDGEREKNMELKKRILSLLIPFMFPLNKKDLGFVKAILKTKFAQKCEFFRKFHGVMGKLQAAKSKAGDQVQEGDEMDHKELCKITFEVISSDEKPLLDSAFWVKEFEALSVSQGRETMGHGQLLLLSVIALVCLRDAKGAHAVLNQAERLALGCYSPYPVTSDKIFKQLKQTLKNKKLSVELILTAIKRVEMDKDLIRRVFTFALLRSEKTEFRHVCAVFIHQLLQKCFSTSSSLLEFWMAMILSTRSKIEDPVKSEYLLVRSLQFLANIFERLAVTVAKAETLQQKRVENVIMEEPSVSGMPTAVSTPARNTRSAVKVTEPVTLPLTSPRQSRVRADSVESDISSTGSGARDKAEEYRREASDLVELLLTHCVQHDSPNVRKWGLECVKILLQWKHLEQVWKDVINHLLRFFSAIQSDKSQLNLVVSKLLGDQRNTRVQDRFVSIVTNEKKSDVIRFGFIELCSGNNPYMFEKLVPFIDPLLQSDPSNKFLHSYLRVYDGSLKYFGLVQECLNHDATTKVVLKKFTSTLFESLDLASKKKLFSIMINASVRCETAEVKVAIQRTVRKWILDTTIINAELEICLLIQRRQALTGGSASSTPAGGKRRKKGVNANNAATTASSDGGEVATHDVDWVSRTEAVLEFAQSGKRLKRKTKLIQPLFKILKICIAMEEQTPVEYLKQLMLTSLTVACEEEENEDVQSNLSDWVHFQVESVIDCLRISRNPQTHHHALILLNYAAKRFPEQVLHGIMSLFTFMGSSILRQDDAYSTQLIQQTVTTLIPTLSKSGGAQQYQRSLVSAGIYRVFTSAVQDIPVHRRVPIFKSLVHVLDPVESMWQVCFIIVDEALMAENKKNALKSDLELAKNILWSFEPLSILKTLEKMYMYMAELPVYDKLRNEDFSKCKEAQSSWSKSVVDLGRKPGMKDAQFLINFTLELIAKVLEKFETVDDKSLRFDLLLEKCLGLSRLLSLCQEDKIFRLIANRNFEIMDKINAVVEPPAFVETIENILEKDDYFLKKRILDIFNQRLIQKIEYFGSDLTFLVGLVPTLLRCGKLLDANNTAESDQEQPKSEDQERIVPLIQTAFLSLKLLARHLAVNYPDEFIPVFDLSYSHARHKNKLLASSALLCLSELFGLKSMILPKLSDVTKSIQRALKGGILPAASMVLGNRKRLSERNDNNEDDEEPDEEDLATDMKNDELFLVANNLLLVSGMTALIKFVENLGSFVGTSFLTKALVMVLGVNQIQVFGEGEKSDMRKRAFEAKLRTLVKTIAFKIPLRNSLAAVKKSFGKLHHNPAGLVIIVKLLKDSMLCTERMEFVSLLPTLFDTFLDDLLVYRYQVTLEQENKNEDEMVEANNLRGLNRLMEGNGRNPATAVEIVEDAIIESLVTAIVLKLSQGTFRPFYHRVYDWASDSVARKITFYRFSGHAAERLKSLFVTFAGYIIEHAAGSLNENVELTKAILHYFYHIFVNDREGFVTTERFNSLVKPLVDLIESEAVISEVIPIKDLNLTIVQLAVATNDLNRWQHLIELIASKSQHAQSKVRLFTISTLEAVAQELEKDFLPLLPPAVPFIADLLGDDDPIVEKATKKMVVTLEAIVGESLQPYFSS